jgi:peroxiredoxin Q/BCP
MHMRHRLLVTSFLFAVAATAHAQNPASTPAAAQAGAPQAPEVGVAAPNFTAVAVSPTGESKPTTLTDLKGKVVVLAFYPLDRSTGCTAELTKFRDEYAKLFGDGVVLLPISIDSAASHASWSKDMKFPFSLVVDSDQKLGKLYGSTIPGRAFNARTIFVIGKDGKITYRELKFGALSEDAYAKLAAEVQRAKGT